MQLTLARSVWMKMRRWLLYGVRFFFPARCVHCLQEFEDSSLKVLENDSYDDEGPSLSLMHGIRQLSTVCVSCRLELLPEDTVCCPRCGNNHPQSLADCPNCRQKKSRTPPWDGIMSLGSYEGSLRKTVLKMKSMGSETLSASTGRLFWERYQQTLRFIRPDIIVPVPLYWMRQYRHGVNSPEIVGEQLAERLNIPLWPVVRRIRNTPPQASLSPRQRRENVRGAFSLDDDYPLAGKKILLVDDILTTGATCGEITRLLKQGGAKEVVICVICKAVPTCSSPETSL